MHMIILPYCEAENIEGADECDECAAKPLTEMSRRIPASSASRPICSAIASNASGPSRPPPSRQTRPSADVLKKMVDERIGCVMVVDSDKLVGIFSERDALMKLNIDAAKSPQPPDLAIHDRQTPSRSKPTTKSPTPSTK